MEDGARRFMDVIGDYYCYSFKMFVRILASSMCDENAMNT